jgi:hypothetical protein
MIFIALLVILIFSIAAVFNGCGKKITIDLSGMGSSETNNQENNDQDIDTDSNTDSSPNSQDDNSSLESSQDGDNQENDQQQAEDDDDEILSEPTIKLSIYKDATYSPEDDVCFYRVKATVTGNPEPDIEWSKDDSNNAFGDDIVQVNLKRGETYTLTATAKNSEGSKTSSIDLTWGCD